MRSCSCSRRSAAAAGLHIAASCPPSPIIDVIKTLIGSIITLLSNHRKKLNLISSPEVTSAMGPGSEVGDGDDEEMKRERRRRRRQKFSNCCKQMAAFLFSHIGLAAMVVAYSIMGGFLFRAIEAPAEHSVKVGVVQVREQKIDDIWRLAVQLRQTCNGGVVHQDRNANMSATLHDIFSDKVRVILTNFKDEVVNAVKASGWDGQDDMDETKLQWSFAGALLYAVTVITTIGYGHVAPKTDLGRVLTMVYALIGIPLTFLYLSNIGNFMANCFRMFYKRVCCDILCCEKCDRARRRERVKLRRQRELAVQRNILLGLHPGVIGCNNSSPNIDADQTTTTFIPDSVFDDEAVNNSATGNEDGAKGQCDEAHGCQSMPVTSSNDAAIFASQSSLRSTGSRRCSSLSTLPVQSRRSSLASAMTVRETAILDDDDDTASRRSNDCVLSRQLHRNARLAPLPVSRGRRPESNDDERYGGLALRVLADQRETDIINSCVEGATDSDEPAAHRLKSDAHVSLRTSTDNDELPTRRHRTQSQRRRHCSTAATQHCHQADDDDIEVTASRTARRTKSHPLQVSSSSTQQQPAALSARQDMTSSSPAIVRASRFARSADHGEDDQIVRRTRRVPEVDSKTQRRQHRPSSADSRRTGDADRPVEKRVRARANWAKVRDNLREKRQETSNSGRRLTTLPPTSPTSRIAVGSSRRRQSMAEDDEGHLRLGRPTLPNNISGLEYGVVRRAPTTNATSGCSHHSVSFQRVPPRPSSSTVPTSRPSKTVVDRTRSAPSTFVGSSDNERYCRPEVTSFRRNISDDGSDSGSTIKQPDDASSIESVLPKPEIEKHRLYDDDGDDVTVRNADWNDVMDDDDAVGTTRRRRMSYEFEPFEESGRQMSNYDPFDYERMSAEREEGKVTVPIVICLIIIAGYIFGGAVLFTLWEDWDYLTGSYFCFITLSTIGFGDIVPGTDMDKWASHEKLVLCALWLAFGLSLLAMCFNLMQEEVKEKCKWIGLRLGLLRDDEQR